jgi:hypothetical protein
MYVTLAGQPNKDMPTNAAISFGRNIELLFRKKRGLSVVKGDEIAKFTHLADCFNNAKSCVAVENYHGKVSQVEFNPALGHRRLCRTVGVPRCELSDLLFVTYSINEIRLTFLQAKATVNHAPLPIILENAEQYAILKHRPVILNWLGRKVRTGLPNDILRSAVLPSVGSFGVFFNTVIGGRNIVDFHYIAARDLALHKGPWHGKKYTSISITNRIAAQYYRNKGGFWEVNQCDNLSDFAAHLFDMYIGTPILSVSAKFSDVAVCLALKAYINQLDNLETRDALQNLMRLLDVGQGVTNQGGLLNYFPKFKSVIFINAGQS